jgi:hypothetical protein
MTCSKGLKSSLFNTIQIFFYLFGTRYNVELQLDFAKGPGRGTCNWTMFDHLRIMHKFHRDFGHATTCIAMNTALAVDIPEIQPMKEESIDRSYLVDVNGLNLLPNWAGSLLNPVISETVPSNPYVMHG